jgi:type IV pilus assembly protein PilO
MGNLSELPSLKQWAILIAGGILLSVGLNFTLFKSKRDANDKAQQSLNAKVRENNELESYRPKLKDMERQVANLKQQLDIERRIVPDDKQVDGFIKMMDAEALRTGIEIRRYSSKPVAAHEYYTEVPFEMEIDGPYYSVLNFFDRVAKLDRIVNISNVLIASTKKASEAKVKHTYLYAANESIVATCQAATFFSHDTAPPPVAPAGKASKGTRGGL